MTIPVVSLCHMSDSDVFQSEERAAFRTHREEIFAQRFGTKGFIIRTRHERWHLDLSPEAQKIIATFREAGAEFIRFDTEGEIVHGFHLLR